MKRRIVPADEDTRFRESERSLKGSINKIYAKANEITHQKNLLEEEINLLCEKRLSLLQSFFLSAADSDAKVIKEILADANKLGRYLDKFSDKKLRKEVQKLESTIKSRQTAMGRFETLRKSLEAPLQRQLEELHAELTDLTHEYYSKKIGRLRDELKVLKEQEQLIHEKRRKKEEEVREAELALNVREKPREMFKWW